MQNDRFCFCPMKMRFLRLIGITRKAILFVRTVTFKGMTSNTHRRTSILLFQSVVYSGDTQGRFSFSSQVDTIYSPLLSNPTV